MALSPREQLPKENDGLAEVPGIGESVFCACGPCRLGDSRSEVVEPIIGDGVDDAPPVGGVASVGGEPAKQAPGEAAANPAAGDGSQAAASAEGDDGCGAEGSEDIALTTATASRPTDSMKRAATLDLSIAQVDLLRGVSLPKLLKGFGKHFMAKALADQEFTQAEAEWLFAHSRTVQRLSEFLSHSWRDKAWIKFLALCLYYNGPPAALFSLALSIMLFFGQLLDMLPTLFSRVYKTSKGDEEAFVGCWCSIIGVVVYPIALLTWHHAPACLGGGRQKAVFFDKLCVHQTDNERKQAGIRSFAAFIAHADRVLILWSPGYFTRLWCTLEVAALVHAQHNRRTNYDVSTSMTFRPLQLASLVWSTMAVVNIWVVLFFSSYVVGNALGLSSLIPMVVGTTLVTSVSPIGMHACRGYVRDRDALTTQLADFKAESTSCFSEQDREVVYATITKWFGSLDKFDRHVQTRVAKHVRSHMPDQARIPLRYAMCFYLPGMCTTLDWWAGQFQLEDESFGAAAAVHFLMVPLLFDWALAVWLRTANISCVKRKRDSAAKETLVNIGLGVSTTLPLVILGLGGAFLRSYGVPATAAFLAIVLFIVLWTRGELQRMRLRCRLLGAPAPGAHAD